MLQAQLFHSRGTEITPRLASFFPNSALHHQMLQEPASSATVVTLKTTMGTISIELYASEAPATCRYFSRQIAAGKYNGTSIDRIVANFIVQGGPRTSSGGIADERSLLEDDEPAPSLKHVGAGVVGLASTGSQFYITLSPQPKLDGKFVIFGRVYSGMDVLGRIAALGVDDQFRPFTQVRIVSSDVQELPRQSRPAMRIHEKVAMGEGEGQVAEDGPTIVRKKRQRDILQTTITAVYDAER